MMRKCRNVYSKLETEEEDVSSWEEEDLHIMGGGGFIIGFIISFRVQEREGGGSESPSQQPLKKLKTRSSRREAQDEKLKTWQPPFVPTV